LRRRFEGQTEGIFKALGFLNPVWFDEIAQNGVPEGALSTLCDLAKVDEGETTIQLVNFAKNYSKLRKNIQADFRPNQTEDEISSEKDGSTSEVRYELDAMSSYRLS